MGYVGKQVFELSNHLGNVLATITDKKLQVSLNTTSTAYFEADVQTVQDYYAFGMQMPGRKLSGGYRFGFNTQEKTNEISGAGNHTRAMYWEYDISLGSQWRKDPNLIHQFLILPNSITIQFGLLMFLEIVVYLASKEISYIMSLKTKF